MLLQRVAPDLLPDYVTYYLGQAGKGGGRTADVLERAFPLPAPVVESLKRQIDVVLGGI
jgi:hypothetical protein